MSAYIMSFFSALYMLSSLNGAQNMSFQICPHFNIPQKIYVVSSLTSLAPVERIWLLGPFLICNYSFLLVF